MAPHITCMGRTQNPWGIQLHLKQRSNCQSQSAVCTVYKVIVVCMASTNCKVQPLGMFGCNRHLIDISIAAAAAAVPIQLHLASSRSP